MKNIIEKIKKNILTKKVTTIIFMIALFLLFIVVTLWLNNLNLEPIDFTSEKLYTLTDISKEKIKNIEDEVNIYFIGYNDNADVLDLANQYHSVNNKINIETATSTERPDLVNKYGIDEGSIGVIVESNNKNKILSEEDFYTYDLTSYEQIDITEEKLTNSILYVVAESIPKIYILEGYSDFSASENMNYLTMYLKNEVTTFETLNILATGNIPDDCDTLIINSPSRDFDDIALNAISNYINNGGNILWFNLAVTQSQDFQNVNKILALYGINSFDIGVINETESSKRMSTSQTLIFPTVNYSAITKNIPEVLMVNATKLNFVSDEELQNLNVTKTDLMQTSDKAFFRTDFTISSSSRQNGEEEGSFIVGAELEKIVQKANENEKEKVSKLIIYGENLFISDFTLSESSSYPLIAYSYNKSIAMDSISYLVDRQEDIEIRKNTNTSVYTATVEQNNIIQTIIYGIPIAIIFAGILVWQHRKRKK